jgi:hypothetical protein
MMKVIGLFLASLFAIALTGCASTTSTKQEETKAETSGASATKVAPDDRQNDSYKVENGDSLWTIAAQQTVYGDPYRWPLLYKANRNSIEDADLIHTGQLLVVGRGWKEADIRAAVLHARTRGEWSIGVAETSDRDYLSRGGVAYWTN